MGANLVEIAAAVVFFIAFYGLITSNGILKTIVAVGLMEVSVVMLYLGLGYSYGMRPPITEPAGADSAAVIGGAGAAIGAIYADPLPQSLTLTAIIIGTAVTAVSLTMYITQFKQNGTVDWDAAKAQRAAGSKNTYGADTGETDAFAADAPDLMNVPEDSAPAPALDATDAVVPNANSFAADIINATSPIDPNANIPDLHVRAKC